MATARLLLLWLLPSYAAQMSRGTIAVTGGTGRLGRRAVSLLLSRGYSLKCLVRSPPTDALASGGADASAASVASWLRGLEGVEVVEGDVTDAAAVATLLRGCSGCVAMHGARRMSKVSDLWRNAEEDKEHSRWVNYEAVKHLIEGARQSGSCKRIVRITGKGEAPWSPFSILLNTLGSMAKAWNYEGEQLLRNCTDVDYTIIRPGVMGRLDTVPPKSLVLADDGGDLKVAPISYEAIASLCVDTLAAPNAARSTLCAMTGDDGTGADEWQPLLQKVQPDRRAFPTDMLHRHRVAVRVGASAMVLVAAAAAASVVAVARALVGLILGAAAAQP